MSLDIIIIIVAADGTGFTSEDICGERLEELCDEVSDCVM